VARRMGQPGRTLRSKNALEVVAVCRVDGSVAVPAAGADGKAGSPGRCGSSGMGANIWAVLGQGSWRYLGRISLLKLFQEIWVPTMTTRLPVVMGHRLVFTQVPCSSARASSGRWEPGRHRSGDLPALGLFRSRWPIGIAEDCSRVSWCPSNHSNPSFEVMLDLEKKT
jgi:hypothetical protein